MSDAQPQIGDDADGPRSPGLCGMLTFTILWKDNPSRARTKIRRIQATDLETAKEAAQFLISTELDGIGVVIGVIEGEAF